MGSACSKRRNCESVSVMLVNVSPAEHLSKMTLNALRYGQMFAAADKPRQSACNVVTHKPKPSAAPPKCDPKIRQEIFSIYQQHCPEKSNHDIEVILSRFSGKEAELLDKARKKYASGGM